jgi:basic amino acid/polyamine antiporter, APA family
MAADTDSAEQTAVPDHRSPGLSLWDSICLIVGIIIGASIYQFPPLIFSFADNSSLGMIAWIVGGLVSLIGALSYAEMASAYRSAGGDYTYLTRAYGPRVGFIFAWAELSVIRTGGSVACMAYIFANYATEFYNLGPYSKLIYAIGGILLPTIVNAVGVRPGRVMQNSLTIANFVGLGGICLIGLWYFFNPVAPADDGVRRQEGPGSLATFAVAMVFVFYAYGGWNEAAFISSEVKNPKRNIRRALIIGTSLVMVIYIAVNLAYLAALGYGGICRSNAVAGDMFALPFGDGGRKAISALVMVSSLGSINGLLFTGMRLYGSFGNDHRFFRWLAGKKGSHHSAIGALLAQAAFSLLLILVVESTLHWRQLLVQIAPYFNLQLKEEFHKAGDIERIATCTAPVFWVFFLLTACSLFILRIKDPERERPFKVPFYPVLPLLFCASCAFMLYRSGMYALEQEPAEALIVAALMLVGIPFCLLSNRSKERAASADDGSELVDFRERGA